VASVIVHATSPGVGYPELKAERLADEIAASKKRVEVIDPARDGGVYGAIAKGMQLARRMVYEASKLRRVEVGDEHLCLGVKCGYSDTTSGIAGNPAVGYLFDKVVKAGGTAFLGETTEIIGPSTPWPSAPRIRRWPRRFSMPSPTGRRWPNLPAWISGPSTPSRPTSRGAQLPGREEPRSHSQGGTSTIQGVLQYGERPKGKGLYFVDCWMGSYSIFAGYAAAGSNLVMFQLGGGGLAGRDLMEGCPSDRSPLSVVHSQPQYLQDGQRQTSIFTPAP